MKEGTWHQKKGGGRWEKDGDNMTQQKSSSIAKEKRKPGKVTMF